MSEWLRGLGLEQYVPAFRANDIDEEILRRLTGEDLRELGVTSSRSSPETARRHRRIRHGAPPLPSFATGPRSAQAGGIPGIPDLLCP